MGMNNSDIAHDVVDDVLKYLGIKDERSQDERFNEIAEEVIKRLKREDIEVNKYDVAEMLDG